MNSLTSTLLHSTTFERFPVPSQTPPIVSPGLPFELSLLATRLDLDGSAVGKARGVAGGGALWGVAGGGLWGGFWGGARGWLGGLGSRGCSGGGARGGVFPGDAFD